MQSRDAWEILRTVGDLMVSVEAAYDPRAELYNLVVRLNGEIWSVAQSEDPITEARAQIETALVEALDEKNAIKLPTKTLDGAGLWS